MEGDHCCRLLGGDQGMDFHGGGFRFNILATYYFGHAYEESMIYTACVFGMIHDCAAFINNTTDFFPLSSVGYFIFDSLWRFLQ